MNPEKTFATEPRSLVGRMSRRRYPPNEMGPTGMGNLSHNSQKPYGGKRYALAASSKLRYARFPHLSVFSVISVAESRLLK